MQKDIALIQKDITFLKDKVGEIHHVLVGNGNPGLIVETERLKTHVDIVKWAVPIGTPIVTAIVIFILNQLMR